MNQALKLIAILAAATMASAAVAESLLPPPPGELDKTRRIRFVEDDAQNYMVSKIYELKYQKANDIVPFILGSIRRYANNGSADRINYPAGNKQLVTVSCPIPLMPYIDDMIAKLDRPGKVGGGSGGIEGTGITRSVFVPQYRSSQKMVDIMVKTGIPSNATEGANQDAVVAYDPATNLIYWKDSVRKDEDLKKYLAWLDRPVPQFTLTLNVYEIRDSDLMDLGIDYLAWKNGPGLNLLDVGAKYLEGSALTDAFGPYGFFLFAPSFDFSFVRILQQNGRARLATSASLTIATGQDASMVFVPTFQNVTKDLKFAAAVVGSPNSKFDFKVTSPVIALSGKTDKDGLLGTGVEDYAKQTGVLTFNYALYMKNVVERNNHGDELFEESTTSSAGVIQTGSERLLSRWEKEENVEQTIGVPFLCELPVLKYIFGTTTTTKEKYYYLLTVKAELLHPDAEIAGLSGKLTPIPELVKEVK